MLTFYVSPKGKDTASGTTREEAFATLGRARDAVREAKKAPGFSGAQVIVQEGSYAMRQGLHLEKEDSGTAESPIVWRGEGHPTFSGSVQIKGFTPVTDPEILARLDESARSHVLQCDLWGQGVTDFGQFRDRGGGRTNPAHMELFYRNQRQTLSRWPNEGFTRVPSLVEGHINTYIEHEKEVQGSYTHFHFQEDRPLHWKYPEEVLLHGYWSWDWADRYIKPVHWDMENHILEVVSQEDSYDIRKNCRFRYLNILEELDSPGEWYADKHTGILYFWSPDEFEEGFAEVTMLEEAFLSAKDTSHITLEGMDFCSGRATAVEFFDSSPITLRDCHFYNLGSSGVNVQNGLHVLIDSCSFASMGDGGIELVGGDRKTLEPSGNRITNCDIHHFGEWSRCYCVGIRVNGVAIRVDHNSIHDAPQEAMGYGGNDHLIEYNDFYNLCQDADDSGATHTGRDWTQRGTVLRYNHIHGVANRSSAEQEVGIMGIYLDDWTSGHVLYGNIFEDVARAVMLGSGRDNTLKKNVFVNCAVGVSFDARGLGWAQYYFDGRCNTLFDLLASIPYDEPPYLQKYPQLSYLLEDDPVLPKHNAIVDNYVWGCNTWIKYLNDLTADILVLKNNEILAKEPADWRQHPELYPGLTAGSSLDKKG